MSALAYLFNHAGHSRTTEIDVVINLASVGAFLSQIGWFPGRSWGQFDLLPALEGNIVHGLQLDRLPSQDSNLIAKLGNGLVSVFQCLGLQNRLSLSFGKVELAQLRNLMQRTCCAWLYTITLQACSMSNADIAVSLGRY